MNKRHHEGGGSYSYYCNSMGMYAMTCEALQGSSACVLSLLSIVMSYNGNSTSCVSTDMYTMAHDGSSVYTFFLSVL